MVKQKLSKVFALERFRVDKVQTRLECLLHILVLNVACDSYDARLLMSGHADHREELPDFFGGLVSVHEGHVAVHQNYLETMGLALLDCFFNQLNCLLAVVGKLGS